MRKSVINAFLAFNIPFEGLCDFMYLDVKGLVTTGVGQLIDPKGLAIFLPWRRENGMLATVAEIEAEWSAVKARVDLAKRGGMAFKPITKLRLRRGDIEPLVRKKLLENESIVRARFAKDGWDTFPACAQLAVHSMAWAMGPHGFSSFPKFCAHLSRKDFAAAAAECDVSPRIGTILLRNEANRTLLRNAARVVAEKLDPELLIFDAPTPPDEAA